MAVVLVVCLILVVFDSDEVAVYSFRVERKGDKGIDCSCFGDDFECPRL